MALKIAFTLTPPPVINSSDQTTNTSVTSTLERIRRELETARSEVSSRFSSTVQTSATETTIALKKLSDFGNWISAGVTSTTEGIRRGFETARSGASSRFGPAVQTSAMETIIALKNLSDFGNWISAGVISTTEGIRQAFGTARSGASNRISFGAHKTVEAASTAFTQFSKTSFGNRITTRATPAFKEIHLALGAASSRISSELGPIVQRALIETIIGLKKASNLHDRIRAGVTLTVGEIVGISGMVASASYFLYARSLSIQLRSAQQSVSALKSLLDPVLQNSSKQMTVNDLKRALSDPLTNALGKPTVNSTYLPASVLVDNVSCTLKKDLQLEGASLFGVVGRQLRAIAIELGKVFSAIKGLEKAVADAIAEREAQTDTGFTTIVNEISPKLNSFKTSDVAAGEAIEGAKGVLNNSQSTIRDKVAALQQLHETLEKYLSKPKQDVFSGGMDFRNLLGQLSFQQRSNMNNLLSQTFPTQYRSSDFKGLSGFLGERMLLIQAIFKTKADAIASIETGLKLYFPGSPDHANPQIQSALVALKGTLNYLKDAIEDIAYDTNIPPKLPPFKKWFQIGPGSPMGMSLAQRVGLASFLASTVFTAAAIVFKFTARIVKV